jgi:hypothetical protein
MAGPSPVEALTYSTLQLKPIYGVKLQIVNDGGIEQVIPNKRTTNNCSRSCSFWTLTQTLR